MGIILDEVCCVDSQNLLENENYQSSPAKESRYKDSRQNLSTFSDRYYNSSFLKTLPQNEIKLINLKLPQIEYKSLKTVPINLENVIRRQSGNPLDHYDIIKKLGKGTFGAVYKVMHKLTGTIRAMKVISKHKMKSGFTDDDIFQEINILKKLEHPHIIKIYEFYTYNDHYYLINEFCTEGDLSEKVSKLKKFPEFVVKILMIQIFNAVKYLNEKNVIHGDLKLENIMIDSYLNNGDLIPQKKNVTFIASLLEDVKEIDEILKKTELKRSNTFKMQVRKKTFKDFNEEKNNKENPDNVNKLLELRLKRRSTLNGPKLFERQHKRIEKENNEINIGIAKSITNDFYEAKNDEEKKKSFGYLNGEDDEDESDEKNHNQPNGAEIDFNTEMKENGKPKNTEKSLKRSKFLENSYKKSLPTIKEYEETKFKKENYNSISAQKLKKTNTINVNAMKIKNFELKLIDFGCSKIFSKYKKNFKDTIGTLIYCSPEVLKNNYNRKCDIWSCGVIMYVLLSGHFPFYGKTEDEISRKILSGKFKFDNKYFEDISEEAKDLIRKCLTYDKNKINS